MKQKKQILFLTLALLAFGILLLTAHPAFGEGGEGKGSTGERVTVLCVGLDEAAGNTDVMMLLSVDTANRQLSVLQIPRDTYCRTAMGEGKINAIYPSLIASGCKENEALLSLTEEVSRLFGVKIDAYAAIDVDSLALLVDKAGGLALHTVEDLTLGGEVFCAGEHRLDGAMVVRLIRHRASYAEGDLGRLDAQKLILGAAYRKLREEASPFTLIGLLPTIASEVKTTLPLTAQLALGCSLYRDRDSYTVRVATLPGEAVLLEGETRISYYAVNRPATVALFAEVGLSAAPSEGLTSKANPEIGQIYEKSDIGYTIYTEDTLDSIQIKTK